MGDGSGLVYVGLKLFGVDKTRGSLEARCCTVQKVLQRTDSEPVELVLGGVMKYRKGGYPCWDRRATRTQENLERIAGISFP